MFRLFSLITKWKEIITNTGLGLGLALLTALRVVQDGTVKKTFNPQSVDNSRPSLVHTMLKPIVVFLSRVKRNGYFILLVSHSFHP